MSAHALHVEALVKRHGDTTVLDAITLEVPKGKIVSIIGASGGGKSTLLRCIDGLEPFQGGTIEVAGHVLRADSEQQDRAALHAVRLRVGMVFQQWHLFAHQTALENVIEAPIHVRRLTREKALERARLLLDKVGVRSREQALPHRMSGGEQQRVAIARALAMDPEILLLDEPTSALDPERVDDLLDLLHRLRDEGTTMLVVTHDMRFAREAGDHVAVLHRGKVVEQGDPREILAGEHAEQVKRLFNRK